MQILIPLFAIGQLVGSVSQTTGPDASARKIQVEKLQKEMQTAMQKFQACSQVRQTELLSKVRIS